jgi:hypothetical protein
MVEGEGLYRFSKLLNDEILISGDALLICRHRCLGQAISHQKVLRVARVYGMLAWAACGESEHESSLTKDEKVS